MKRRSEMEIDIRRSFDVYIYGTTVVELGTDLIDGAIARLCGLKSIDCCQQ
jgi:hypothetical protein